MVKNGKVTTSNANLDTIEWKWIEYDLDTLRVSMNVYNKVTKKFENGSEKKFEKMEVAKSFFKGFVQFLMSNKGFEYSKDSLLQSDTYVELENHEYHLQISIIGVE